MAWDHAGGEINFGSDALLTLILFTPSNTATITGVFLDGDNNPINTGGGVYSLTGTVGATPKGLFDALGLAARPTGAIAFRGRVSGGPLSIIPGGTTGLAAGIPALLATDIGLRPSYYPQTIGETDDNILLGGS